MTLVAGHETHTTIPRALRCTAYRCGAPIEHHGLCAAHRRGLALTASISDAVMAFLAKSSLSANSVRSANGEVDQRITEAGECFARGLALFAGTQFAGETAWNPEPIVFGGGRWRVNFVWFAATGELAQIAELDDDDDFEDDHDDGESQNADL